LKVELHHWIATPFGYGALFPSTGLDLVNEPVVKELLGALSGTCRYAVERLVFLALKRVNHFLLVIRHVGRYHDGLKITYSEVRLHDK
jgi:hypothetical protein